MLAEMLVKVLCHRTLVLVGASVPHRCGISVLGVLCPRDGGATGLCSVSRGGRARVLLLLCVSLYAALSNTVIVSEMLCVCGTTCD